MHVSAQTVDKRYRICEFAQKEQIALESLPPGGRGTAIAVEGARATVASHT